MTEESKKPVIAAFVGMNVSKPQARDSSPDILDIGIADVALTPEERVKVEALCQSTGLKNTAHVTLVGLMRKGKHSIAFVTARGVDALCRDKVKSALLNPKPEVIFLHGVPINVTMCCTVESKTGYVVNDVGCVDVGKKTYAEAVKACATNARMRALRAATGLDAPDETAASELLKIETQDKDKDKVEQ